MIDNIIYGKDNTNNIVSIEIEDNKAVLFIQEDQKIIQKTVPNKQWILTHKAPNKSWIKLKGNQYFSYGKQFETIDAWREEKKNTYSYDPFTINDLKESCLVNKGITYYKGLKPKEISILSTDIETTSLDPNLPESKVLLISNYYRNGNIIYKKLFAYDDYESEFEMIEDWSKWVRQVDPSIICGHNIFSFDIYYLNSRYFSHYGKNILLGRNNSELRFDTYQSKLRKDQSQDILYHRCYIYGREIVDTMFLAIQFDVVSKKYESYALKSIIKTEGLEKADRQFYDASRIRFNYKDPIEWAKIKEYCKDDAEDALNLFDILIPQRFYLTQSVPKSFQAICYGASGSQINSILVRSYLQVGHSIPKTSEAVEFEGAISFGNVGIYSNVIKWDVSSLYPNIMLQYEIYDKQKDPEGNMLKMLKFFTEFRLKNKKLAKETGDKYYEDLQSTAKIFINSTYGFLGSRGLNFNSPSNAQLVTKYGREILTKSIDWATNQKQLVIANGDTDSISVCKQDQSIIDEQEQKDLLAELNSLYPEKIKFEEDGYFPRFIVLKAKNYILWDGKKIKTKGSALKSGTKEQALKDFMNDIIVAIVNGKCNYTDIYNRYLQEAMDIQDIKRWSSRKSISTTTMTSERTNETKIVDAIKGTEYKEGDRVYLYFKEDKTLSLIENFDGKYDKMVMVKKLHDTAKVFHTIIDKDTFPNYSLKKNQAILTKVLHDTKFNSIFDGIINESTDL